MGKAKTLGELKASGYEVLPVKAEMRRNLIAKLRRGEALFPGIVGYDETVIPQIVNAILGGQDVMLLGERGQARLRLARRLTALLDEEMPVVKGAEIAENPFRPITAKGRTIVAEAGAETPIAWPLGTNATREAGDSVTPSLPCRRMRAP